MTVTGGNLYENCVYAEELVKEKRLFDAVISLEVCILLVPLGSCPCIATGQRNFILKTHGSHDKITIL